MEQGQDKLVNSPICDSNACYESEFTTADGPIKTWLCMTSGYTSNTTMKTNSETVKLVEETTADLIKDTMPEKGMIFPEPIKGQDDWQWTCVKAIAIPKEDQEKYPDPKNPGTFYKNKMDMKNPLRFDKLCFMDAAEEMGMFKK